MKTRRFAASGLPAVVLVAGLAALAPLAWLQYRWIGQVSEAERGRAHAELAIAASRFAQEFDDSIRRPLASMAFGRFGTEEPDLAREISRRYARWTQSGSDPSLVRRIYVAEPGPAGPALSAFDPPGGRLAPADWPAELEPIRASLASPERRPGPPGEAFAPPSEADVPVLVAPLEHPRRARNEPPPPEPGVQPFRPRGWLILLLDLDTLRRDVLPPLFERAFPSPGESRYEALVVSRAHPDRIIFASDPALPRTFFDRPDARAPVFSVFPGMRRVREPEGEGRRRGPPERFGPPGRPGPAGGWELLIKNRSGSLEQAVAATRRRNLAVSFGILLVMAASLATLVVSARRAQRLADLQMEFVAGVSHELKTPLAVICSAAENLADGVVGGEAQARRYGAVIRSEGKRLTRMVEQILAFAGIQRNRTKYELEPVEVPPIVARAVALCDSERPGAAERIDTETGAGLPLILADPISLTHCLRNLVENAIAHGGGEGRVGMRARAVEDAVEIEVEDHGAGIDPGDLPNIFDPFFRGARAVADQVRGFGLGLTLVKHIVEAHAGTIAVRSAPGEGALFTVRIPAAAVPEPAREDS